MKKLPMPFGNPTTYPGHEGVDYGQPRGTPIPASGPGRISKRTQTERGGLKVWVDYDEFPAGCDVGYAHLDNYNGSPPVGTRVNYGDTVGLVGNSGYSTGPHLHNEVEGHFSTSGYWQFFDSSQVVSAVRPNQRVAGPSGAKARMDPSTNQPAVEEKFLAAGAIGTFDGWIRGQAVEGNDVWFRGAYSGLWFWSGGFTDKGTHDLADLNVTVAPNQRVAGQYGAKARLDPSTNEPAVEDKYIKAGDVGTFNGWINGQNVEGNPVWFRGAFSGTWFWSGGFTDVGTHDLEDLNTKPEPEPSPARTVAENAANVRDLPYKTSPVLKSEPSGATIEMNAWAHGDVEQGNDIWFRRLDGDWMWSGGFTEKGTAGLPEVPAPPRPNPPSKHNPLGLPEYVPVYPRAVVGLEAPLGFVDCIVGGVRASRKQKGNPPVPTSGVLSLFIFHWAYPPGDDTRFFSTCNSGGSCPTTYINADAEAIEFIRPGAKPASTGPEWNWRSWAVEMEPINDGTNPNVPPFTDAQVNEAIEQMVFLREHDGKELDGALVDFQLDREHVIADRDTRATTCPGDWLYARIPWMIEEAQRRYDARHPGPGPDPEPGGTLDPAEYPALWALRNELDGAFGRD